MRSTDKTTVTWTASVGAMLLCCGLATLSMVAQAAQSVVAVEGVNFNVKASMKDNLSSFVGKRVSITINSGKSFSGTIKEVGDHLVHLEKLEGKEYFDALISVDNISAIDSRFRKFQR